MWIAKPVPALSEAERAAWREVRASRARSITGGAPLAQSLFWARGIEALGLRAFAVFSPEESAGGIVFESAHGNYECVNGPLLDWDSERAPAQLATFAMAVSRLGRSFEGLALFPRWEKGAKEKRLTRLPLEPFAWKEAATIRVPLHRDEASQRARLSPRLRRTLLRAARSATDLAWAPASAEALARFSRPMAEFAARKGFTVPPDRWFEALSAESDEGIALAFSRAEVSREGRGSALAELLIALDGREAHYLFGREERSGDPGLSPSALAHWMTLRQAADRGVTHYDLNGYLRGENPPEYAGVCRFKAQFGGSVLDYEIPEFRIR